MIIILRYLRQLEGIVDDTDLETLERLGDQMFGLRVLNINSTRTGGGVAEMLMRLIPLFNSIGINARWNVIHGSNEFMKTSKLFYNALQGQNIRFTKEMKTTYKRVCKDNEDMAVINDDIIIVHDHQPLGIVHCKKTQVPWIWRCHADIHTPNMQVWKFLVPYIKKFNHMVVTMEKYKKKDLKIPQSIILPSIDPISEKNMKLPEKHVKKILSREGIDIDKPIISQVSRFDRWKDPIGVIKSFRKARQKVDCKLVLLGESAEDDPEGPIIYRDVVKAAKNDKDIHIISKRNNYLVNAIQTASSVGIQKSLKEGFAITVSEAMWKETPVIGTSHGGIPLQIIHGKTGFIADTVNETSDRIVQLLLEEKLAKRLGRNGREHVRKNFLITRHALDYLKLFKKVMKKKL